MENLVRFIRRVVYKLIGAIRPSVIRTRLDVPNTYKLSNPKYCSTSAPERRLNVPDVMYRTFLISGLVSISDQHFLGGNEGCGVLHAKISSSVKHNFGSVPRVGQAEPTATTNRPSSSQAQDPTRPTSRSQSNHFLPAVSSSRKKSTSSWLSVIFRVRIK